MTQSAARAIKKFVTVQLLEEAHRRAGLNLPYGPVGTLPRAELLQKFLFFLLILCSLSSVLFAADDGFESSEEISGKYFTIYYHQPVDIPSLCQRLNVSLSEKILAARSAGDAVSGNEDLGSLVDVLYGTVGDTLDMHIYDFHGNIKICRDHAQLNDVYISFFKKDLESYMASFYVYDLNTIYISSEDFKREVLGHEISHAIINNYFVVSPPVKVQEILSKYVEFQLRKAQQTE
jgi:hypothetical protein